MTRLAVALVVFAGGIAAVATTADRPVTPQGKLLSLAEPTPPPVARASRSEGRKRMVPRHRAPAAVVTRDQTRLDITMYCATGNQTASGVWPQLGMAAGNRWPFGTRLHIAGYGDVTVTDRIGWGSDVDIFGGNDNGCESRALSFGRRHALVSVVTS